MTRGRKPSPQRLVESLDGSDLAKRRLKLILMTLSQRCTVAEAAAELGVSEAAFYKMRSGALQQFIERLEPKPRGRPPEDALQRDPQDLQDEAETRGTPAPTAAAIPRPGAG